MYSMCDKVAKGQPECPRNVRVCCAIVKARHWILHLCLFPLKDTYTKCGAQRAESPCALKPLGAHTQPSTSRQGPSGIRMGAALMLNSPAAGETAAAAWATT